MSATQAIVIAGALLAVAVYVTRDSSPAGAVLDLPNIGPWQMQVTGQADMAWRINTKTGAMSWCSMSGQVKCWGEK